MKTLALLLACLYTCATDAWAGEMRIWKQGNHLLVIHGPLTAEGARRFEETDLSGIRELVITSSGGEVGPAVDIGRRLRQHGITVTVPDYCTSACANWIFIPATQKRLRPGALLGLHRGKAEIDIVRLLVRLSGGADGESRFLRALDSAETLYREAGIDPAIQHEAARHTQSLHPTLVYDVRSAPGQTTSYVFTTDQAANRALLERIGRYPALSYRWEGRPDDLYWFPTEAELRAYGVAGIDQYWRPAAAQDIRRLEQAYRIRIVYTEPLP